MLILYPPPVLNVMSWLSSSCGGANFLDCNPIGLLFLLLAFDIARTSL